MKIKFSGINCIIGSDEELEMIVDIRKDFHVQHEGGNVTSIITEEESMYIDTDTFECEVIQ